MMAQAEQCGTGGCVGSFPLPSGLKIKLARSRYAVARDLKGVTAGNWPEVRITYACY